MLSITASVAFVLICGIAVQVYGLSRCMSLVSNNSEIRYINGNELALLWSCLSGMLASWTSVHLLVKSRGVESRSSPHKQSINWLPVGVWPQIILWIAYLVLVLGLNCAASTIHYKTGTRGGLPMLVFNSILPTASAAMSMPNLIKRLRSQSASQKIPDETKDANMAEDNISLGSCMDPFQIKSPQPFDNMSIQSGITRHSGVSGHTKYTDADIGSLRSTPQPKSVSLPPRPSGHELCIIPSNTTTLVPNNTGLSCVQHIKGIAISVTRYSPTAVATALTSILIHTLLLCGAVEQHQHGFAISTPLELVSVPALYPDNIERTVSLSINCIGRTVADADGRHHKLPQRATILLEHVSGYPSPISRSIQSALVMQNHRVCTYDRPGYMFSPQGYTPILPVTMERALSNALRKAGEAGPFYVVGHRSGAEYAQIFANMNMDSVVGMAFIYPTDTALGGLLDPRQTASIRLARAQAMMDNSLLPETNLLLSRLNIQRVLAALGTWMTSPPTISDTSSSSQNVTEWALSSPCLAQAQYFEMQQQPQLTQAINDMRPPLTSANRLPTILFGVNADRNTQAEYIAALANFFKVEISDQDDLQPLSLNRVAQQISLHISRLH